MASTSSTGAISGTSNLQSTVDKNTLIGDFDTFLNMLITQLQNQDPLSPMESSEFTNQLVQFASVEQAIKTNTNLESLLGLTVANQAALASNYLEQWVEAPTDAITLQDGESLFTYTLPVEATSVKITISDLDGKQVQSFNADTAQGIHKILWDGTDEDGQQLADGAYRVTITAKDAKGGTIYQMTTDGSEVLDASGNKVPLMPNAVGKVTAYTTDYQGGTAIVMGDSMVDLAEVKGVFSSRPDKDAIKVGSTW